MFRGLAETFTGTPVTLINTLEPDYPQSEFCMALLYTENAATNGYEWLNVDCSSAQSFICEYGKCFDYLIMVEF